ADALCSSRVATNLRVDADDLATRVEEWATRVPTVDRRVRLDGIDDVVKTGKRPNRPLGGRHDSDREGARLPERAADRGDRLADDHLGGIPQRNGCERVI